MGLDGVEIVMAWEEAFGIVITDAEAAAIRTPRMATDLICRKLGVVAGENFCLSQRIFYRLRNACVKVLSCSRGSITTQTRLGDLIPLLGRQQVRTALSMESGLPLPTIIGVGSWSPTVGEFATRLVGLCPRTLLGANEFWTRQHVREVVRAIVSSHLGIRKFSDDADFIHDLRID